MQPHRPRPRTRVARVAAVAVTALLISACSGGDAGVRSGGASADSPSASTEAPSETPTTPEAPQSPAETTSPSAPGTPAETPDGTTGRETIATYLAGLGATQRTVAPSTGFLDVPRAPGWTFTPDQPPYAPYGALVFDGGTDPQQPPRVLMLAIELGSAAVDPARLLELAPNELLELPGFEAMVDEPDRFRLAGFDAVRYAGTIPAGDSPLTIIQYTAVVPAEVGLYVVQLNAYARPAELETLTAMMERIDTSLGIDPR
ncbi:LpqN/LpqT family lipoprotein [Nocardioides sp.]|uniref:LpqN/LpqT family lipoprotein n=1 Tax=Nocardioides sp. TaxID=35761 RepID=UPI003510DA47